MKKQCWNSLDAMQFLSDAHAVHPFDFTIAFIDFSGRKFSDKLLFL
jgi:hypothetical protein